MRKFTALDACHTKSKYSMILMIAVGIDANSNVLPLAWALVPTESEEWWTTWFCEFLQDVFEELSHEDIVFMSDRDKGLADSRDREIEAPASPVLQLRPKRTRQAPVR